MAIRNFQKDLDTDGSYSDPLAKIMDGEYKVKMIGKPEFYDSETTSWIEFHFCFIGIPTADKVRKRKFLNTQSGVNFMMQSFKKAGIDVSNWRESSDIAAEFERACEAMNGKIYVIKKRSANMRGSEKVYHDFDIVAPSNDIPPQSSPEEELPF